MGTREDVEDFDAAVSVFLRLYDKVLADERPTQLDAYALSAAIATGLRLANKTNELGRNTSHRPADIERCREFLAGLIGAMRDAGVKSF